MSPREWMSRRIHSGMNRFVTEVEQKSHRLSGAECLLAYKLLMSHLYAFVEKSSGEEIAKGARSSREFAGTPAAQHSIAPIPASEHPQPRITESLGVGIGGPSFGPGTLRLLTFTRKNFEPSILVWRRTSMPNRGNRFRVGGTTKVLVDRLRVSMVENN